MYIGIINNETNGGLNMVMITKLIMIGIAVVCAVTLAFILFDFVADKVKSKSSKKRNRIHFYVARDMDGRIYLYLGKPERRKSCFITYGVNSNFMVNENDFKMVGLNQDDFKDLKWEDEPVEVFLNIEDLIMTQEDWVSDIFESDNIEPIDDSRFCKEINN